MMIMKVLIFLIFLSTVSVISSAHPVYGNKGLVSSCSDLASAAGIETLKAGGNVVDAAVTTAFALAVTRPYYASMGGGGFLLLRMNGKISALDYREHAPLNAHRDLFKDKVKNASEVGALAVATPGNVKGLFELHKKYGKLSWANNLNAAVKLAQNGFTITEEFARITNENASDFSAAGKKYFTVNEKPLQIGQVFKQPQLALALKIIQEKGGDAFYSGLIADDIAKTIKHLNGILTKEDLKKYNVRWMQPVHAKILGADVFSMPPPSSGGAILLAELKMAERLKLEKVKAYSVIEYHLMAEIMARAFFERQYIADPLFSNFDVSQIYSDKRINDWVATIDENKKTPIDKKKFEIKEGGNTTHYVVVDSEGNAVTATTTVNTEYGSGVFTEKYGINLNNEMDDFTTRPGVPNVFGLTQGEANTVAPLKTPLSSMTPTLVEKNGKLFLALGAPGGPRIINAVFQTLYHSLVTDWNADQIVQAPRIHHQFSPDKITHDKTLTPDIIEELTHRGHSVALGPMAKVYLIKVLSDSKNGAHLEGAFDNRGEGGVVGY